MDVKNIVKKAKEEGQSILLFHLNPEMKVCFTEDQGKLPDAFARALAFASRAISLVDKEKHSPEEVLDYLATICVDKAKQFLKEARGLNPQEQAEQAIIEEIKGKGGNSSH